ncbi:hypothetical protein JTB14_019274 [Gonioctena quinquepunctata]|nr:hypothetical protein JTB14_019274 [Gonioctena quinquepunctata]
MSNISFQLQKYKNKKCIPVEPEIITKNRSSYIFIEENHPEFFVLPTHIQFLLRERNAVIREFQQSKNEDKRIELLILHKAIVIVMRSSQPDTLPNFISLVIKDSLKNRLIFRITGSRIHQDRFRGTNAASKKLLRTHMLKEIDYNKCCESHDDGSVSDEVCV